MAHREEHHLLQKPLYVFDLPKDILDTLSVKEQSAAALAAATAADANDASPGPTQLRRRSPGDVDAGDEKDGEGDSVPATACGLCNLTFASLEEQRGHVRSDLHGYNLKQKMRGAAPVSEAEFERLVGELDESISGSDSSDSESDEEDATGGQKGGGDTTLSALLKKQAKIADASGAEEVAAVARKRKRGAGKPPMLWFTCGSLPGGVNLGVYRAILSDAEQEDENGLAETIRKKQIPPQQVGAKKEGSNEGDEGGVKLPVTPQIGPHYFLCMIGGGHFAAMIVALAPKTGKKHTGQSERQATVVAHKTFHRYTTRRKQGGSQSANDSAKGAAHSAGSSLRRYNEAALTSEAPALVSYIQSNNLSPNFRFHPLDTDKNYHAPTPLHLAAHMNAPVLVLALLTKAKADPAVANLDEKTPFELAGDRATRDAFRIARYELGDEAADWSAARVPAGVSRAEVEKASSAEKAEEAAREAERRKTETERLRQEEEQREQERREKRVGKGKALGSAGLTEKTAGEKREEEARGLTPEMRMRLERERRARAAEERLKRMQGGR
ncbi:putative ankyrin repeat and zinc finger domain containing protein 1 [Diplodia seriata]|uniref:Putative ankyrin repeat and zinc finger domain containing protein 1 n=1 Tax=Diplodia seriata TaxID=420778 RepID=A0A0G2FXF2_9PEZI|nr:putative ankyrin repeat and zinc finger domain containing protein 1 [Diplodia seriata]